MLPNNQHQHRLQQYNSQGLSFIPCSMSTRVKQSASTSDCQVQDTDCVLSMLGPNNRNTLPSNAMEVQSASQQNHAAPPTAAQPNHTL